MSRARPVGGIWFDRRRSGEKATSEQLELLAASENILIDDLLDEGLRQGEVLDRLREALGEGVIPPEVLERRRAAKEAAKREPVCRICDANDWVCDGSITRHHFVPRWMMLKLENYQAYAARSKCTIPVCVGRHRDLHLDGDTDTPKSIAQFLTDDERVFAQKMLDELFEQVGKSTHEWLDTSLTREYDARLIEDFHLGAFRNASAHAGPAELEVQQGMELSLAQ
jgi:hypothetical protein